MAGRPEKPAGDTIGAAPDGLTSGAHFNRWKTGSALKGGTNDGDKVKVLTTLLEQDRAEIKFWQERLFAVSFLFSGSVLAIVWYTLTRKPDTRALRSVSAGGSLVLCVFYIWFVDFAQNAIVPNDYDLIGIQFALKLNEKGEYLQEQAIYKWEREGFGPEDLQGHPHFRGLVQLNVLLTIAAVLVLVLIPQVAAPTGGNANPTSVTQAALGGQTLPASHDEKGTLKETS